IAVSARSFEQPKPTICSGWPFTDPPVMPADGLFGSFGFAPANCVKAAIAPPMSASYWLPNAPWQSDRMPILIGVADDRPKAEVARTAPRTTTESAPPNPPRRSHRPPPVLSSALPQPLL